jgi:UDPglucose--hexose-1-phosphate uridylyltransferase
MSEFRQDLVSGEWVLIAPERAKKPDTLKKADFYQPKEGCPFEDLKKNGNEVVWTYPEGDNWKIAVAKNKYPAVKQGICGPISQFGPYHILEGVGEHDLFILKDHDKVLSDLSKGEMLGLVKSYLKRYKEVSKTQCGEYIMIFHNQGHEAGASVYHTHSQLISTPIMPPFISRIFHGAQKFYKENKKHVFSLMVDWEKEQNKRIIFENEFFIAFCPFVSLFPYQVLILPKDREAHFDQLREEAELPFAETLLTVLKKIKVALNDPSFNYFIHSAPVGGKLKGLHEFYAWHVEILPKFSTAAGFEIATGVDINVIDPDKAAELLRNSKI